AQRAGGDLPLGDLRTAMGLGVRAEVFPRLVHVSGHARQIAFEAVDIEQERGGGDLVAVHGPGLYLGQGGCVQPRLTWSLSSFRSSGRWGKNFRRIPPTSGTACNTVSGAGPGGGRP